MSRVPSPLLLACALSTLSGAQETSADPSPSWRLYRATLAAAEGALRLHETDRAQHWLAEAPPEERGWEWRHLSWLADRSAAVFPAHDGTITDLALSPDGRWLATACGDGTARLLDAATGATRHVLRGHTAAVWSPAFTRDGRTLATASSDGSVRLWDVESGALRAVLEGNGMGVAALAIAPDGLLAVSSWMRSPERGVWGVVNLWDLERGERVEHIEHGRKPIAALAFSPDGHWLAAGTWDFDVALWELGHWGEPVRLWPPENEDYRAVRDLDVSPDGRELAVAYADGRARVFDLSDRRLVRTLETSVGGNVMELNDVTYVPGGRLATVGDDGTVRLWDVASGRALDVLHGHERAVHTVVASADGARLYTAGMEGSVRVWDLAACDPARTTWRGPSSAYTLALDPAGARAFTAGWEGWLRVVEVESGRELAAWQGHENSGVGADWSADGRWLASTGNDGRVVLWSAQDHAQVRELEALEGPILAVRFAPDSARVASAGPGASVQVWSVPSGEPVATLGETVGARVGYLAWSPDGTRLAAAHASGSIELWDTRSWTRAGRATGLPEGQVALAFRADGTRLAGASGARVRVFDPRDGALLEALAPAAGGVNALAYSPDGTRLAAALGNNSLEVWRASSGEVLLRVPFTAGVWATTWGRDGRLFALPMDGTVRLLEARP